MQPDPAPVCLPGMHPVRVLRPEDVGELEQLAGLLPVPVPPGVRTGQRARPSQGRLPARGGDPRTHRHLAGHRVRTGTDRRDHRCTRAALDAGADPAEVSAWINDVQQERARLEGRAPCDATYRIHRPSRDRRDARTGERSDPDNHHGRPTRQSRPLPAARSEADLLSPKTTSGGPSHPGTSTCAVESCPRSELHHSPTLIVLSFGSFPLGGDD